MIKKAAGILLVVVSAVLIAGLFREWFFVADAGNLPRSRITRTLEQKYPGLVFQDLHGAADGEDGLSVSVGYEFTVNGSKVLRLAGEPAKVLLSRRGNPSPFSGTLGYMMTDDVAETLLRGYFNFSSMVWEAPIQEAAGKYSVYSLSYIGAFDKKMLHPLYFDRENGQFILLDLEDMSAAGYACDYRDEELYQTAVGNLDTETFIPLRQGTQVQIVLPGDET